MPLRRNAQPRKRLISSIFPIPEGLGDLDYADLDNDGELLYVEEEEDDDEDPSKHKRKKHRKKRHKNKNKHKDHPKKKKNKQDDGGKKDIRTPDSISVFKQKIRTKADGSQVVDVTMEVDRILRANKYEFRITKKDTGKTTIQTEQA